MKVIRCENGHYYDSDLFSRCPHCREPEPGNGSGKKQGRQKSFFQAFRKESKPSGASEDPVGSEQNAGPDATGEADGQGRAETVCEPTEILSKEEIERLLAELDGQNGKASSQNSEADGKADEASSNNGEAEAVSVTADAVSPAGDAVPPTEDAMPATDDAYSPTVWIRGGEETTDRRPVAGWLVGIAGPCYGRSFEILRGRNTVGRSEANDISIKNDKRVSREKHMNIVYDPAGHGYYIEPGDSRGLVYCNGRIILAPTAVTGSDLIEIGGGRYVIQPLCGDYFPEPDA